MRMLSFLLFLQLWWSLGEANHAETHQRFHYGATFRHQGVVTNGHSVWTHSFEVVLPKCTVTPLAVAQCPATADQVRHNYCQFAQRMLEVANGINMKIQSEAGRTVETAHRILGFGKRPNSNSRSKRSLFDFIGDISSALFGTATNDQVRKLSSHIRNLYNAQAIAENKQLTQVAKTESFMKV
jgi:hypothetical protein